MPLRLAFAIPDHPWVDSADGAAVRIAMSVGVAGQGDGRLAAVHSEAPGADDTVQVTLEERSGRINADLTIGANVAGALPLRANERVASRGVQLIGAGFIVTPAQAAQLGLGSVPGLVRWLRPEFQHPEGAPRQETMTVEGEAGAAAPIPAPRGRGEKAPWPETLPEQVATVARLLAESPVPLDAETIAARHTGRGPWKKRLPQLLETLVALGRARHVPGGYTASPWKRPPCRSTRSLACLPGRAGVRAARTYPGERGP